MPSAERQLFGRLPGTVDNSESIEKMLIGDVLLHVVHVVRMLCAC